MRKAEEHLSHDAAADLPEMLAARLNLGVFEDVAHREAGPPPGSSSSASDRTSAVIGAPLIAHRRS